MVSLHTEICDMLGIEYPIFGFCHCRDVVAEISNAGGIGFLGVPNCTADTVRADIKWLKEHTDKPFGVDLPLPQAVPQENAEFDILQSMKNKVPKENIDFMNQLRKELGLPKDSHMPHGRYSTESIGFGTVEAQKEMVDVICDMKPALFAGALGMNKDIVDRCHRAGSKAVSLVGTVKQARRAAEMGVDIIVAQGTEAGGHTGRIGTIALVPQVVDAVRPLPVLAAGGIADGRGVVAGLALGAVGVWTGTVWLTVHEYPLADYCKDKILAAAETDAVITTAYTGKTVRFLNNRFVEYWQQPGAPKTLKAPYQKLYLPLIPWVSTEDSNNTWERLKLQDWITTPAGQAIGMIRQRKSTRQTVYDMVSQATEILA